MSKPNEWLQERMEPQREQRDCGCRRSDAWRCAKGRNLSSIACPCRCHQYVHDGLTWEQAKKLAVGPASPVRPLSSDFLDDLRAKLERDGALNRDDASALLAAHDTLIAAYHETEPVRDPAPPTCDHCKGPMELIWVCDHKHPVVYRLARSAGIELGVRKSAPPDLDAAALSAAEKVYWQDDGVSRHNLAAAIRAYLAMRGVRDPQPELGNDIRRLKIALAAAISALKAGEPWHYSGCAGCAEIEAAMIGGPPPKETPQ